MNQLLILGAGGHAKVVAETAITVSLWDKLAFLDDRYPTLGEVLKLPVVGRFCDAPLLKDSYSDAVVALGNNSRRMELLRLLEIHEFMIPALVHSRGYVSPNAVVGSGTVIFAQAAVNAGARLGRGVIVNTGATVDHDCFIGDGVHVCPGAHLAGEVRVGTYTWIGIGAVVMEQISIGECATVGAGAVVIEDVPPGVLVAGTPARIIKTHT
jgi:sugar O-acyltransferase (sialic acid O-acetyltransferase NeuD family)